MTMHSSSTRFWLVTTYRRSRLQVSNWPSYY